MDVEVKNRLKTVLNGTGKVFLFLVFYYLFTSVTHVYIPCAFRLITGLKCPGCGITHMLIDLLHFDLRGAYMENSFLFFVLPVLLIYGAYRAYRYVVHNDRKYTALENAGLVVLLAGTVVFGIARNL